MPPSDRSISFLCWIVGSDLPFNTVKNPHLCQPLEWWRANRKQYPRLSAMWSELKSRTTTRSGSSTRVASSRRGPSSGYSCPPPRAESTCSLPTRRLDSRTGRTFGMTLESQLLGYQGAGGQASGSQKRLYKAEGQVAKPLPTCRKRRRHTMH